MADPMAARTAVTDAAEPQISPRVVMAGAIGSVVEYFDFGVYGYLATILAAQFFANTDSTSAMLNTLAAFALAFLLRPLGGVLFGHFGDRHGRKNALALTVICMALASTLIGVLPTYAAIGVGASALLVLARAMQGLAAGGELGGAASFVGEYSPARRRGFFCSTTQTGAIVGALLASLVVSALNSILGAQQMNDFGWRIPFLIALPLGVVGLWIRSRLHETPRFENLEEKQLESKAPIAELFRNHLPALVRVSALSVLLFSVYYIAYVYVNIHLQNVVKMPKSTANWATTATLAISALAMPAFGAFSDKVGRKPIWVTCAILSILLPIPAFMLFNRGGAVAVITQIVIGLIDSALMGVAFSTYVEAFPTRVRYTGIALGFNIGAALAGGTAPYISTLLVSTTGSSISPAFFLIGTAIITLIAALRMKETAGDPLRDA